MARPATPRRRSISTASRSASAFCRQPANFEIGDAPIAYSPADSFVRAILVGLANTARVSVLGWILAIALGFVLGVLRLATNPAVRGVARAFVELVRNVPLLLLLLFLAATMHTLPPRARAASCCRRVRSIGLCSIVGSAGARARRGARRLVGDDRADAGDRRPQRSQRRVSHFRLDAALTDSTSSRRLTGAAALLGARAASRGAHFRGRARRGARGPARQRDAAVALGLSRCQTLRFVVVPQALRAMVPLLATNCVSLTKNSSLAVAIGFPDVVSILNTTANQTGHAIETMLIMIVVYLDAESGGCGGDERVQPAPAAPGCLTR